MQDHTISDKDILKSLTVYLTICIINYISKSVINSPKDHDLFIYLLSYIHKQIKKGEQCFIHVLWISYCSNYYETNSNDEYIDQTIRKRET